MEETMSSKDRLQHVQSLLEERGVLDVKFFFKLGVAEVPNSQVRNGVANFLDAYLKGRYKKVDRIGDSLLAL
jgi:hypothetical protein